MRNICTSIVATLVLAGMSFAATINVPGDYPSIQDAIDASANGDEILVAPGTYTGTGNEVVNTDGKAITLRATGTPEETIIDGESARRVVRCSSGEGAGTIIEGFTITGGSISGISCSGGSSPTITDCTISGNIAYNDGGGIYCDDNSNPTITGCTISDNTAYTAGGGIRCDDNSNPTISNCTISDNTADYGGGIYCFESNPTISGCTITDNIANSPSSGKGGGIRCSSSDPTITGCTISNNTATGDGGGISCDYYSNPTLTDCTITNNNASSGGGIYCYISSPTITGCTISDNTAYTAGGGIRCDDNSSPTISDCMIESNSANLDGGGINCDNNSSPTISDCMIESNSANLDGGGIYCYNNSNPTITGCTISNNTANNNGGGVYSCSWLWNCDDDETTPIISNSIMCGNTPNQIGGAWIDGGDVCLALSCSDTDEDGTPDECVMVSDGIHEVPAEYSTVQEAVDAAGWGDTVLVGPGEWHGSGEEVLSTRGKAITIRSTDGPAVTILDGQGERRVITCDSGETTSTVIDGFTIQNGLTTTTHSVYKNGGGILCLGSSPTISNCIITLNRAGVNEVWATGGGIALARSEAVIYNCAINKNVSRGTGGVISLGGAVRIVNTEIRGNVSEEGLGGGVYLWGATSDDPPSGTLEFVDSLISGNEQHQVGGGGYFAGAGLLIYRGTATALNCSFTNNTSSVCSTDSGGGITCNSSHVELVDCEVSENESCQIGGGLYDWSWDSPGTNALIQGCYFASNNSSSSVEGTAILLKGWSNGEISNTTVCGSGASPISGPWQDGGGNTIAEECPDCPDVDGDGMVGVNDVLAVVAAWGSDDPDADVDGDGTVGTDDLLAVLATWGPCE